MEVKEERKKGLEGKEEEGGNGGRGKQGGERKGAG